jgi:acylphosphatase
MENLQKISVIYSGRVQGVGFRMTVRDLASKYPVTGSVCNVSDGSVLLEAIGRSTDLLAFLEDIDRSMSRNIENCLLNWLDGNEHEFTGFSIGPDRLNA